MTRRTSKTQSELTTLMMHSPFVVASRMTEFWMTVAAPTASSKREASQMVTEKMQAMGESVMAINMAMTKVAMDTTMAAMTGMARNGENDADDVMSAGLRPYSKRVSANRSRLCK
ncbi:MAG: hypothetical protein H7Y08_00630 [Rhizobiaceae bacterium]|nr:hypothetical protein [Rhizobiaceae bacterium]